MQLMAMETSIDHSLTPGFIVGIIDGDNELVLSFGHRDKVKGDTLSSSDVFPIGSVSKVLTAASLVELEASGVLSLSSEFNSLLPDEFANDRLSDITLQDMLAHQSGLPRDPAQSTDLGNPIRTYQTYSADNLFNEYRDFNGPSRMLYSNYGYAMIGLGVEQANGIATQLGMAGTSRNISEITVQGHDLDGLPVDTVDYGIFAPSGGYVSSCKDLMKFLRYCLDDSPDSLWANMGQGLNKYLDIGLGWHIIEHRKSTVYMHTGRSLGHAAFIGLNRETDTAVVILSNSALGTDDLGMEILRSMNNNWRRKS